MELASATDALLRYVCRRAEVLGLPSENAYADLVECSPSATIELAHLVDALTNGQTELFRDPRQLDALVSALCDDGPRPRAVWCAGCSTGEEPYSVAMLAREVGCDWRVLGTDVNTRFLQRAREGRYRRDSIEDLSVPRRDGFENTEDGVRIPASVASTVTFEHHNLLHRQMPRAPSLDGWDAIVCRNVFIYFHRHRVVEVVGRLAAALRPGGWLVLGASDPFCGAQPGLSVTEVRGQLVYRRCSAPARTPRVSGSPGESGSTLRPRVSDEANEPERTSLDLRAALERAPDDVVARLSLGNVLLARHDFSGALREYGRAIREAPLMAEAHYWLGVTHRKLGDHQSAKQALGRALFLDLDFWPAAYLLAASHEREGMRERAAAEFRHALELVEHAPGPPPFRSRIKGLRGLELRATEVAAACRRRLTDKTDSRRR
jgi:chemotaxis protein methyltransferase CheR